MPQWVGSKEELLVFSYPLLLINFLCLFLQILSPLQGLVSHEIYWVQGAEIAVSKFLDIFEGTKVHAINSLNDCIRFFRLHDVINWFVENFLTFLGDITFFSEGFFIFNRHFLLYPLNTSFWQICDYFINTFALFSNCRIQLFLFSNCRIQLSLWLLFFIDQVKLFIVYGGGQMTVWVSFHQGLIFYNKLHIHVFYRPFFILFFDLFFHLLIMLLRLLLLSWELFHGVVGIVIF